MSDYELLSLLGVLFLAAAFLCAFAAIRYGITRHVAQVYNDVSGRRRRIDLEDRRPRQHGRNELVSEVSARMQALTLVANAQSQDEIATRIADGEQEASTYAEIGE